MKKELSLKKTLLNNFLLISIIPFVIALIISIVYLAVYLNKEVNDEQTDYLNLISYQIETVLGEPAILLNEIDIMYNDKGFSNSDIASFIDSALETNPLYESIRVVDNQGKVIITSTEEESLLGFDMSYQAFFEDKDKNSKIFWSEVFMSPESSNPTIAAVKSGKGDYSILVEYSLEAIQSIISELGSKEETIYSVVNNKGQYIAHSDYTLVDQRSYDENFSLYEMDKELILQYNQSTYIARIKWLEEQSFYVMVRTGYYDHYINLIKILVTGLLIIITVSIIIAYLANEQSKAILNPVDYLLKEMDKITAGRYGETIELHSYKELNLLTQYFNNMSKTVKENFDYLSDSRAEMESLNQDLMIQNDEIARSEIEIATILGNLYNGIILLSPDLTILRMNHAVYELLDIESTRLHHHVSVLDFFRDNDDVCRKHSFDMIRFSKKKLTRMVEVADKLVEQNIIPLLNRRDELTGIIVTFNDVTEQHKLENQLNQSMKMEAIGRLSGGIAHDFNNILQIIIGYGELIELQLSGLEDEVKLKKQISLLTDSAKKAEKLIKKLMLFSKMDTAMPERINVNEAVLEIKEMLSGIIGDNIQLYTELEEELPFILADKIQIEQTLMNLCVNARDAMPEGGSIVLKTQKSNKNDKEYVAIHVVDTGTGIPKHIQDKIFDPFFTTKDVGKGTGLGLATVLGIVQKNHGYVELESEEGEGTAFKLYFPSSLGEMTGNNELEDEIKDISMANYTVLLAEDDPGVREIAKDIILESGASVIEAADGDEAITLFYEHRQEIDILMFDVLMPGITGLKAYQTIKNVAPDIKVIFTTGYSNELLNSDYNMNLNGKIIQKPYTRKTLLKVLYEVIQI